ncbi:MAG: DUF6838 family protein [Fusobacterium sp.]|jgi:hypothetical protein
MQTLRDTLAVIVSKVREQFADCSVSSQDITEGFERKTIYIYFDNVRQNDFMKKFTEKKITIVMIYFPQEERKNTAELLEVQDKLSNLFSQNDTIELKEGVYAYIQDIHSFRHEGTLQFECQAYIFEEYDEVEHELMEELTHKGGIE